MNELIQYVYITADGNTELVLCERDEFYNRMEETFGICCCEHRYGRIHNFYRVIIWDDGKETPKNELVSNICGLEMFGDCVIILTTEDHICNSSDTEHIVSTENKEQVL